MRKKTLLWLAAGAGALLLICCVAGALFLSWANRPENQAAFNATDTAQAVQQAASAAASAATGTAGAQALTTQLAGAQPVFQEAFAADSPFLKANLGDLSLYMRDGVPEITLAFAAGHLWPSGQSVADFVAELDCSPLGEGAFCGLAYGLAPKDGSAHPQDVFYASYIGPGGSCGFTDQTGSFSSDKLWTCNPPASPAAPPLQRLRVERAGQQLRFYVNGQLMDQRQLSAGPGQGVAVYFGRASGNSTGIATVQLDNFNLWKLPAAN